MHRASVELRWNWVTVDLVSFPLSSPASGLRVEVLTEHDLYQRDLLRGQLLAATIEAFALPDTAEDDTAGDHETIRRAPTCMRSRLGDPVSVSEIATAAGLSVRGLQLLFQRQLASTTVAYPRRLPLERAHRFHDLHRWHHGRCRGPRGLGHTNLGRCSSHYRAEHDETPAQTLCRPAPRPPPSRSPRRLGSPPFPAANQPHNDPRAGSRFGRPGRLSLSISPKPPSERSGLG